MFQKFKSKAAAMFVAFVVSMAALPAMAGGGGGGFDTAAILALFVEYTGYAVIIIGGWSLALWSLRAMGLLKKG